MYFQLKWVMGKILRDRKRKQENVNFSSTLICFECRVFMYPMIASGTVLLDDPELLTLLSSLHKY